MSSFANLKVRTKKQGEQRLPLSFWVLAVGHQLDHNGFLGVQTVFGFVKNFVGMLFKGFGHDRG